MLFATPNGAPSPVLARSVFLSRNPFKIGGGIIQSFAVQVIHGGVWKEASNMRFGHKPVDITLKRLASYAERYLKISRAVDGWCQYPRNGFGSFIPTPWNDYKINGQRPYAAMGRYIQRVAWVTFPYLFHALGIASQQRNHKDIQQSEYGASTTGRKAADAALGQIGKQP